MSKSKRISKILLFLLIGLAFGSGIASAEYLGPDRTYQIIEYEACEYGVWADENSTCINAAGDEVDCTICGWECDPGWACGSATYSYVLGTRLVEHTVTHTDPEATVASSVTCADWGDANWCVQLSSVTITANEPVAGDQITLIEGTQNGGAFACAANTCTVNMVEGSNALTYWALSSYGDSSRMGSRTVLQDTFAPEIQAWFYGLLGENNWFITEVELTVEFSDASPGSGLSMTETLINGVVTNVSSPVMISDGVYHIQVYARDIAGWEASGDGMVYIDTTGPVITGTPPPVEVANSAIPGGGFVNGSVIFTGTYGDATSGVSQVQFSPDGSNWVTPTLNADGTWTYDWDSTQVPDGSYTPLLYAVDNAGNRSDISLQPVTLDNTPPVLVANQPVVEVVNSNVTGGGYMNGSVVFTGTCNDPSSGVNQLQFSPDGSSWVTPALNADGTWTYNWDSTQVIDGSYTPLAYAIDNIGNRIDITLQPISLDNSAPAMSMTGSWYIWDSGHIVVYDTRVGIARIELSVRDDQGRWPAREWEYDTSKLEMDLQWDRKFGDGTVAPTGSYEVLLQAWDELGNGRWITSRIYIPEAGATAVIPLGDVVSGGTFEDTPTPMAEQPKMEESGIIPAAPAKTEPAPTATMQPSSTPSSLNFSSAPLIPASGSSKSATLPVDPNLLTGAAALAAAASATAYSLQKKKEMDDEIKRREAQSRAEAMAKVRASEATKVANYLQKLANDKIQAEKAEYMALIARTGGRAFTDLSDEQKEEFLAQGAGAVAAVNDYFAPQIAEAKRTAEQNAEWSRIIASTGGRAISDLSQEQLNEFMDQGTGATIAAGNYMAAQQAAHLEAVRKATPQIAEMSRLIASTGGRAITDLSDEQFAEFMDQGLGAQIAAGNYFAAQQAAYNAAYREYLAEKANAAYLAKMDRVEQETEGKNVITQEPASSSMQSLPMTGMAASLAGTTYYPMSGAYTHEDLQAMINENFEKYLESQGKPSYDDLFRQSDFYKTIEPTLLWINDRYDFAKDTLSAAWHESDVYKWLKPKTDWVADKYMGIWDTVGTAWKITTNGNATFWQRLGASAYMTVAVIAHVMLAVGLSILAYESGALKLLDKFDKVDAIRTLITAPVQYADGDMSIGDLSFQILIGIADLDLPKGFHNLDEALKVANTSKIMGNLDEAADTMGLFYDYGKPAAQLLDSVDVKDARKLLNNLDAADIEMVLKLDDNIIKSLADMDAVTLKGFTGKLNVIADLGDDAIKQINKNGPDMISFLSDFGDDGLKFINNSDEAAAFVVKHWSNTPENVALAMVHGKPAMQLLDSVDTTGAKKLLDNLNGIDVENILKLDDDIIQNLANMDSAALKEFTGKFAAIADLGDDAVKQINQHGTDILPFLNDYGADGLKLIKDNEEAAEFVLKHWNDAPENIALAVDYGKPAMQLLDSVDAAGARKLLDTFDPADIDSVLTLSNDGIKKLGNLDADTLVHFSGKMDLVSDYGDVGLKYVLKDGEDVAGRLDVLADINRKYLGEIVDTAGNINTSNMSDLRLAIEHGNFGVDEISLISQSVGNKGITVAFEAEMKTMDFGKYLTNTIGGPPISDLDVKWHAHHILFKEGNGAAQQALVIQGQAILRKYGIDPVVGPENLIWASLYAEGQHAYPALENVVEALKTADNNKGTYEAIVKALNDMGRIAQARY